jgi:hypothetical protein
VGAKGAGKAPNTGAEAASISELPYGSSASRHEATIVEATEKAARGISLGPLFATVALRP